MSGIINTVGARSKIVSGNVGIGGTAHSDSLLEVINTAAGTNTAMSIKAATDGQSLLRFADDDPNIGEVAYNHTNDYMAFRVNDANRMTIASAGDVTVSTGNLVIGTAGKGIDFGAQTVSALAGVTPSTGSDEILDHYEEGTWTPALSGGNIDVYNDREGQYTRIGRQVWVKAIVFVNTIEDGSPSAVSGLPFTSAVGSGVHVHAINTYASNVVWVVGTLPSSSTIVTMRGLSTAGKNNQGVINAFEDGTYLEFTCTYYV